MASIDFLVPPNFPSPKIDDFEQGAIDPWIEQENSGAIVRRRILTNVYEKFSFSVLCTEVQRQNMRTFYKTTTNGGIDEFNWYDPRSFEVIDAKFETLPSFSHLAMPEDGKEWSCRISLIQTG